MEDHTRFNVQIIALEENVLTVNIMLTTDEYVTSNRIESMMQQFKMNNDYLCVVFNLQVLFCA